jgi:hypothetical protein
MEVKKCETLQNGKQGTYIQSSQNQNWGMDHRAVAFTMQ